MLQLQVSLDHGYRSLLSLLAAEHLQGYQIPTQRQVQHSQA